MKSAFSFATPTLTARRTAFGALETRVIGEFATQRRGGPVVTIVSYAAGDEIFAPGRGCGTVYLIRSGHVRLYKVLQDGRSVNLALLGEGEYFTQDMSQDGYASGCIAEALDDATVEHMDRAGFVEYAGVSPERTLAMLDSQARQLAALHTLVEQLLARDTGVRLATTLLTLADGFGAPRDGGRIAIRLPISHQSLANMIGSNRVTVTRKLLELQESGAVVSEGRTSISIDPDALREIVELG